MNNILTISSFLLEQTAQEKRLTILYVSLFVIIVGMLVLDAFAMNKFTNKMGEHDKPRFMHILLMVILAVAVVALIVLFVTGRN